MSDVAGGALTDFRPVTSEDRLLLQRALLVNANMVTRRATPEMIAHDPGFVRYWKDFPGSHEFGFVAEQSGIPVGVVWARHSNARNPFPGHVADDVPELTICVLEGMRGTGIGHDLLTEMEKEGLRRKLRGLSLWVEQGNRSRRLYERCGYEPVEDRPGVMVKEL